MRVCTWVCVRTWRGQFPGKVDTGLKAGDGRLEGTALVSIFVYGRWSRSVSLTKLLAGSMGLTRWRTTIDLRLCILQVGYSLCVRG